MIAEPIDNITPLEAFSAIRHMQKPFIFSGLSEGGKRHTYVSADPFMTVRTDSHATVVEGGKDASCRHSDPFDAVSGILSEFKSRSTGPFPFNSGMAGYFAYDLKDIIDPRKYRAKKHPLRTLYSGLTVPLCVAGFYDPVFIYCHNEKKGYLVSINGDSVRFEKIKDAISSYRRASDTNRDIIAQNAGSFTSNLTRKEYLDAVARAQEYIAAGDIYQINLSQRLSMPLSSDAFTLYSSIFKTRPAPFCSFMDMGDFQIISNSPERLLRVKNGTAVTEPIKGTRPRGFSPRKDTALIEELRMSAKERAEHVMIVDLERNDLGRISVAGTVEVTGFEAIETYPTLHHMVSTVRGVLKPGVDPAKALKAIFPGGSVTGAPKIRAMEIIDELEPTPRGIYTGGIGWMDFNGEMDIAMAIRTAVCKGSTLYLHVGGGIVADSVPEDEYEETILKAKDFLDVMGIKGV